ncbi:hypothetical protein N9E25_13365 [Verrucomicrobiales bacterium]|nr:hypothetical protein [Verrucomicrobiales bacterium]MDA9924317.1 hypothetical protein [Verrucomicrobiales bacterium]MDB2495853.1 hypothetical protein [Verrucomicrobiales bacterium]
MSELKPTVEKLEEAGTHFSFFNDSTEAAQILTERGWISSAQRNDVIGAVNLQREASRLDL